MKANDFNNWMRDRVKSAHYYDNDKMLNAFNRFNRKANPELKRHNYTFTNVHN